MARKENLNVEKLRYFLIRDMHFSYSIPQNAQYQDKHANSITFDIDITKMINAEEKILRFVFILTIKGESESNNEIKGIYTTEHLFKVENFAELVTRSEGQFTIDAVLDSTLTGLVYSTVRGLFYQKFNGTCFSNFILPIVRPADLGK
jgi:hypothetical protein